METLIRSAQLAPLRTRLSETAGGRKTAATADALQDEGARLRAQIEHQVRAELTAHMHKLCDEERERARAAGLAAAATQAQSDAANQMRQLEVRLDTALRALESAHRAAWSQLESNIGEVAFAAVCQLVGRKAASLEFVLGLVERTCAQLRAETVATARLHPRDVATLCRLLEADQLRLQALGLKVVADEALELGGCVIEAASGCYDGGLEGQLRRLHAVLTRAGGDAGDAQVAIPIEPTAARG